MKIYLVGGAVRDELLNVPPKEKDWVVVGGTVQEMLEQGFQQVGKDFPVFLHPTTKEEYALARVERKVGRGYTGFTFDTSSGVSLEEDLKRRDLTINAMAKTTEGQLIDPYHGQEDLEKKILRHVSPAFVEDPVRILRVARFAARYPEFQVAKETNQLMKHMVASKEVDALVPERVWKELERALTEKEPAVFFNVLADCDALPVLFPANLQLTPLKQAQLPVVRFAVLLNGLSLADITHFCERYRVPNEYRELALLVAKYSPSYRKASELSAKEVVDLLMAIDAFRRPERFEKFLLAGEAIFFQDSSSWLKKCYEATKLIKVNPLTTLSGKEIAAKLYENRLTAIHQLKK